MTLVDEWLAEVLGHQEAGGEVIRLSLDVIGGLEARTRGMLDAVTKYVLWMAV